MGYAGGVVDHVLYVDIGMGSIWREREQHGEEGILEEDSLPELPPTLLLEAS